jgi:hypothetical protein
MNKHTGIPFEIKASERWNKISKEVQAKILDNAWCRGCSGARTIILESAKMEQRDLILRGKCKACGQEICRVVEPEDR